MTIPEKISNKAMDWKEHKLTYQWVMVAFKYTTIVIILILIGMAIFLV